MTGAKIIFAAGLFSGSQDIAVTGILRRAQGVSFQKLLQTIASAAIGPSTYTQGCRSAALGLFFHFLIAFTASTVYLAASRHISSLLDQPYLSGAIFGILVHFFMSLVIVPLSRLTRPFSAQAFLVQLVIHILFVGLPIALTTMYGPPQDCKGKGWARRQVCGNVFVNKGEGVVKGRDFLTAAMSNARDQGV